MTAFTTLKIAVVAPMPNAMVSRATVVNAGARTNARSPYRRSFVRSLMYSCLRRPRSRRLSWARSAPPMPWTSPNRSAAARRASSDGSPRAS